MPRFFLEAYPAGQGFTRLRFTLGLIVIFLDAAFCTHAGYGPHFPFSHF